ncbi:MAG: clostripain-related cysteine peptidase, partial [Dorea sp.]|nr:clostripain-related cysteine peptidase [Dorea sp.]
GGGGSPLKLIIILIVMLLGGGGGLSSFLGGGGTSQPTSYNQTSTQQQYPQSLLGGGYGSLLGQSTGQMPNATTYNGWAETPNLGSLDKTVADGSRDKRTKIKGNGKDEVTIMVYMCGTDLESRSGMATSDLQEMAAADIADNVNLIVYTGGCASWRNRVMSNSVNQIYQVKKGGLKCLKDNAGKGAMTDPATLADFITWCNKKYPANRNELILWDHGGGSVSGYGYDEKYKSSGSMSLDGINKALKKAGVTFDFIGFDACLMATVENALMLDKYADYMVASEETEPGIGWYYTNWLTKLSQNTSMSTLEIGKNIVDDFVSACNQKCRGQKTTLSVVDLAELSNTVPSALSAFAKDTSDKIQNSDFKAVSTARYNAREFAQQTQIDQIDLVHFASNIGTSASKKLANAITGAVKYNLTSSSMTNAYGLSIYFPYKKLRNVNTALSTFDSIGMDQDYMRCIQQFAKMETGGQSAAGGAQTSNPYQSLLNGSSSGNYSSAPSGSSQTSTSYQTVSSQDAMVQLLNALLGGQMSVEVPGLSSSNTGFLSGRAIPDDGLEAEDMAEYLLSNQFNPSALIWQDKYDNAQVISLPEAQWELVTDLALSAYYDDGEGYVDLGCDNVFNFDEDGDLVGSIDGTWMAINGQTVAYYYDSTVDDGENYTITGHVPAMLNGERVNLLLVFDNENPYGYIAGANYDYEEEVDVVAKNLVELEEGDTLDFLCDFYSYDGEYEDSYYLGDQMVVTDSMEISNVELEKEKFSPMYRFTDIYNQTYWTPVF